MHSGGSTGDAHRIPAALVAVGIVTFTKLHGLQRLEFHDLSWHIYFACTLDMLLCLWCKQFSEYSFPGSFR